MMKLNPKMKGCENNNESYNSGDQIDKSITHEMHFINYHLTYIYDSVKIN